ncbi:MAG: methylated-DNA--[protein]-cysteine S-methyltransferase [Eubacteriales bacterium]
MEFICSCASPLGEITLAGSGGALTGLWFDGQRHDRETLSGQYAYGELPVFALARQWLDAYFAGEAPGFTPPLLLSGSPFRRAVWQLLMEIPRGQTRTYGQLAAELARRGAMPTASARAVGGAVAHNPVSLIVPCHRVVGAGGALTGYAGGIDRKRRLLTLEGAELSRRP